MNTTGPDQPSTPRGELPGQTRVPASLIARALAVPARTIRRRRRLWGGTVGPGPRGGRELSFPLSALPPDVGAKVTALLVREGTALEPATADGAWESVRECDRQRVIRKLAVLDAWKASIDTSPLGKTAATDAFVEFWNQTHPLTEQICQSTLYAWAAAYKERGRVGLLPGWSVGSRDQKIAPEVRERFDQVYLAPQRLSISISRRIVQGQLALEGSPLLKDFPSEATFRRRVDRYPAAVFHDWRGNCASSLFEVTA